MTGNFAVAANEFDVVPLAQLLCAWWLVADQAQTRHAATFLIDRNNWFDVAQITQIIDELSQLRCTPDVATEEDESARLHALKKRGGVGIELHSGNAGKDQLTEGIALHTLQLKDVKRSIQHIFATAKNLPRACAQDAL